MALSLTRYAGMSRNRKGELNCRSPVAGSILMGWYCSPSPVLQTAMLKLSYDEQCSTKHTSPFFQPPGTIRTLPGCIARTLATKLDSIS